MLARRATLQRTVLLVGRDLHEAERVQRLLPARVGIAQAPSAALRVLDGADVVLLADARAVRSAPAGADPLAPAGRGRRDAGSAGGGAALPDGGDRGGDAARALEAPAVTRFGAQRRGERVSR